MLLRRISLGKPETWNLKPETKKMELEGVEPSSKQAARALSTCLAFY